MIFKLSKHRQLGCLSNSSSGQQQTNHEIPHYCPIVRGIRLRQVDSNAETASMSFRHHAELKVW